MKDEKYLLQKLQHLLSHKKSKKYYSKKLGISEDYLEDLLDKIRANVPELTKEYNLEKGTLKSSIEVDFEPKTPEELARIHKIDLSRYRIVSYWSKLKANGKFITSVLASARKPNDFDVEKFTNFLENFKPLEFREREIPFSVGLERVDLEINLPDFHLGKRTITGETVNDKEKIYYYVVRSLTEKVSAIFNIRKIVFPISNDFFHSDTYHNTTTNGTPQDVDLFFNEEYEIGFEILADTINYLLNKGQEIEVILVPGNHDRTKGFFVAHALEVYFRNYKNVTFQRSDSLTKHVVLGCTFIGYHHGYNCKLEDLPLLFATDPRYSEDFGKCRYREIHTGDKHHYMTKEVKGVRIQQLPSLSGTDRWHLDNHYVNQIRAGLALVYHPDKGKIMELEERI